MRHHHVILNDRELELIRDALHDSAVAKNRRVQHGQSPYGSLALSDERRTHLRREADECLKLRERLRRLGES